MDKFTYDELFFMVAALNGVVCQPSTFTGNIEGAIPYQPDYGCNPRALLEKLRDRTSMQEIAELHSKIEEFWNVEPGVSINMDARMKEVGLI